MGVWVIIISLLIICFALFCVFFCFCFVFVLFLFVSLLLSLSFWFCFKICFALVCYLVHGMNSRPSWNLDSLVFIQFIDFCCFLHSEILFFSLIQWIKAPQGSPGGKNYLIRNLPAHSSWSRLLQHRSSWHRSTCHEQVDVEDIWSIVAGGHQHYSVVRKNWCKFWGSTAIIKRVYVYNYNWWTN